MSISAPAGSNGNIFLLPLGITGLSHTTPGLVIATIRNNEAEPVYYRQSEGNIEDIATLGTYAAPSSGKCRFKEIFSGLYQLQLANARFSSGTQMVITFSGGGLPSPGVHFEIDMRPRPTLTEIAEAVLGYIDWLDTPWTEDSFGHWLQSRLDAAISSRQPTIWANAGSTVNLANTTVKALTDAVTLPTMPSNWITASGIAASALNGKGDWETEYAAGIRHDGIADMITAVSDLVQLGETEVAAAARYAAEMAAIAQINPGATPLAGNRDTTADDTIDVFVGDDHTASTPRGGFRWSIPQAVDLTGASGRFRIWQAGSAANLVDLPLQFSQLGTPQQEISVEPTAAQIADLRVGSVYQFEAAITLAGGHRWTPVQGRFSPRRRRRWES